ncbi:MAG TPA: beta-N-acetylhexosaminidase, partial [Pseudobdellovibrionaceae bacterium]
HLIIGISGTALTADEKKFIINNNIGGIVLFDRNISDPRQVHALCSEIQSLRHEMIEKAPLFIGIDMEGGRVARLKAPFTVWPPLKSLGDLDNATVTFHFANRMGLELHAVGINLDFAPCVDVFTNPKNTVIGDRSISSDAEIVARHATALVRGFIKSNIISCAKHFPGHGHTLVDSHEDLPLEELDLQRLDSLELIPFKRSFKARVELVMTSHILFKNIDPEWPVTLSEKFLKKILREDYRYRGLIVTDDLDMKALTKHYDSKQIPVKALQAGADLLLYCNEPLSPPRAIEAVTEALTQNQLKKADLEASYKRILELKKDKIPHPDPMPLEEAIKIIGNPEHQNLAQAIVRGEVPAGLIEV